MGYLKFIRQDWPLVGFGVFMALLSGPGQTFFVGLFRDSITAHFGISIAGLGSIFSAATLISAAVFLWTGRFIDIWPLKKVTIFFTLLFALSAAAVGLSFHIVLLCVAIFGIRHLGQGLMSHISSVTMARYFHNNRAKAISLASMGYSASEAVFPICVVMLLSAFGWRMSWGIIAIFIGGVALPLALWLLSKTTRDLSLDQKVEEEPVSEVAALEATRPQMTRVDVLRDPRFWLIIPAVMSSPYLLTGMFFHQGSLATELGMSLEVVAYCFTVFAVAKMTGSLFIGPIADRYGFLVPYPLCYALFSVSLFVLTFSIDVGGAVFFYGLSGLSLGMAMPVGGSMWPQLFGVRHIGAIKSMIAAMTVVGTGLAPYSFGVLLERGVDATDIAFGGAIYTILATCLLALFSVLEARKKKAPAAG